MKRKETAKTVEKAASVSQIPDDKTRTASDRMQRRLIKRDKDQRFDGDRVEKEWERREGRNNMGLGENIRVAKRK